MTQEYCALKKLKKKERKRILYFVLMAFNYKGNKSTIILKYEIVWGIYNLLALLDKCRYSKENPK